MAMMIPPNDCMYNLRNISANEVIEVLDNDVDCLLLEGWTLETVKQPILIAEQTEEIEVKS